MLSSSFFNFSIQSKQIILLLTTKQRVIIILFPKMTSHFISNSSSDLSSQNDTVSLSTTATTTNTSSSSSSQSTAPSLISSSSSQNMLNYFWIPLLISFSKELTLAKSTSPSSSSETNSSSTFLLPRSRIADVTDSVSSPMVTHCPVPDPKLNYRPVIGILTHPGDGASGRLNDDDSASYIAASYVKFVESAGARVIPLICNEPREILFEKLNLVNGVLFTGGWAKDGLYFDIVEEIFKIVLKKNDAGEHFPLYAICLGFELLTMIISKNKDILESFSASDQATTLQFIKGTNIQGTVFQRIVQSV